MTNEQLAQLGLAVMNVFASGDLYPKEVEPAGEADHYSMSTEEVALLREHEAAIRRAANNFATWRDLGRMVLEIEEGLRK